MNNLFGKGEFRSPLCAFGQEHFCLFGGQFRPGRYDSTHEAFPVVNRIEGFRYLGAVSGWWLYAARWKSPVNAMKEERGYREGETFLTRQENNVGGGVNAAGVVHNYLDGQGAQEII